MRDLRCSFIFVCLGVPAAACYSPNQPIVVTAGDESGGENDGTADGMSSAAGTAGDTAGSTLGGSTGSTGRADDSTGEPGDPVCGNGKLEGDEACDDGVNDGSYGGCTADCSALGPHCGDGEIQMAVEGCDFGDDRPSSSCNAVCQIPGTILDSTSESTSTRELSLSVQGIRVVEQDDELVAVFGGDAATYWRIDPDTLGTNHLETAGGDVAFRNVAGLVDLGDGILLVAGGTVASSGPVAFAVDAELQLQWSWSESTLPMPNRGFVGAAPLPDGVILAGQHLSTTPGSSFSSYWAAAASVSGEPLWSEIEVVEDDYDLWASDFRGLSTGDAVLLTDGIDGGATFRIYNALGQPLNTEEFVELLGYSQLCVGSAGFYLVNREDDILAGFDNVGQPTFDIVGPSLAAGENGYSMECAARDDGSPILAQGFDLDVGGEFVRVTGFAQDEAAWSVDLPPPDGAVSYRSEVFVHVDEARHRVLVFMGGRFDSAAGLRFVSVTALAI